jgi:hypothetical protein
LSPETVDAMRRYPFIALLLLGPFVPAVADNPDFSGAWVAWLCPDGVQRDSGKCSNFVLELHQKDGKLCGAHFFSTAGAERIDEGAAPSVTGDIVDGTATVFAVSSRSGKPVRVRVEMKKTNAGLQWLRMENPAGDYLLPQATRLTKSKSKTLFAPVFEQELRAVCSSAFTMAAQQTVPPAPQATQETQPAAGAPQQAPPALPDKQ